MEETKAPNKPLNWIIFIVTTVLFFVSLNTPAAPYCSMILPFITTSFARALNLL